VTALLVLLGICALGVIVGGIWWAWWEIKENKASHAGN